MLCEIPFKGLLALALILVIIFCALAAGEDPCARNALPGDPPAKRYANDDQSYSTSEVCVDWNSQLTGMDR